MFSCGFEVISLICSDHLSLFVNPTQFGPKEDLDRYPRSFERDVELMKKEKVDFLFAPERNEMYPEGFRTYVSVEDIDLSTREGSSRPGFFRGVSTGSFLSFLSIFEMSHLKSAQSCSTSSHLIEFTLDKRMAFNLL